MITASHTRERTNRGVGEEAVTPLRLQVVRVAELAVTAGTPAQPRDLLARINGRDEGLAASGADGTASSRGVLNGQREHQCDDFVTVTPPRPYAGFLIGVDTSGHLELGYYALNDAGPLMVKDPHPGERQLISALDALLIAQLSSFDKPNLNPALPPPW